YPHYARAPSPFTVLPPERSRAGPGRRPSGPGTGVRVAFTNRGLSIGPHSVGAMPDRVERVRSYFEQAGAQLAPGASCATLP
ncbi:MAG TPA: hypothetical protein VMS76_12310, partial [Planctomycetota bacterium]|nr:hypothetical protein [Planctomycetota bacterium]